MRRSVNVMLMGTIAVLLACRGGTDRSTEAQNIALVKAYIAAWNRHDSTAFDTLMTVDAVYEDQGVGFRGQGRAEIKAFLQGIVGQQPNLRWEVLNAAASDSIVGLEWTWESTFTGNCPSGPIVGRRIALRAASIVVIRNHQIARFEDYVPRVMEIFCGPPPDSTGK